VVILVVVVQVDTGGGDNSNADVHPTTVTGGSAPPHYRIEFSCRAAIRVFFFVVIVTIFFRGGDRIPWSAHGWAQRAGRHGDDDEISVFLGGRSIDGDDRFGQLYQVYRGWKARIWFKSDKTHLLYEGI
jgi:hypothetical protein